jgi:tetratricopeptide (TPR) repeat protein
MNLRSLICLCAILFAALAHAQNNGQTDLDKAMELKLTAESIKDLGEVINHCRSALAAGLDATNKDFAEKLLVGTLLQRAEIMSQPIFDPSGPAPQWPLMRRQALLDLEEAAKLDQAQFDIFYLVGRLQALPGGDRAKALKALERAIALAAENPAHRAKCLLLRANLSEDPAARLADYSEAVKLEPNNAEILRTRGTFYLTEKKYDEALADLDQAIEHDPEDSDAHEARGVVLFLLNKNDEALKSFNRVIELQPKSAMAYTHRARIYAIDNKIDEALKELDQAIELEPRLPTSYLLRARLYQQKGEAEKAMSDSDEALRLAPNDPQARQLHAMLLAGSGKIEDAIGDLRQLVQSDPKNLEVQLQLGLFYAADKQQQKAIDIFGEILKQKPDNQFVLRNRGDAWLGLGKLKEAIADYEAALKLDENDSGVLNNLAWLLATAPVDNLRNGQRAIELAKTAARVTEFKQAHILSTLAAAYAETGDFENAKNWSKKAVELAGKENDDKDIREQLQKELASYEANKPWRETFEPQKSDDPEPEALPEPAAEPKK